MPPQSRGELHPGLQSKSTPNLPTLRSLASESSTSLSASGASSTSRNALSTAQHTLGADALFDDGGLEVNSSSDSDSNGEIPTSTRPPPRPIYSHHTRSHSQLLEKPSAAFAPPFYNRPPTPLPPSPSLTSLLRPTFTSRPTTPDSSDHEGSGPPFHPAPGLTPGTTTPASSTTTTTAAFVSKSASLAPVHGVPRAHPQVPTYEYYGFVLYLCSSASFILYLLWAYLPSPFLHALGIHYYPDRWWALAIPAWGVMALGFVYVALACWNVEVLTLPMESVEGLVDEAANVAVVDGWGRIVRKDRGGGKGMGKGRWGHSRQVSEEVGREKFRKDGSGELDWGRLWSEGTDAVMDVPVGGVCEILYGSGRQDDLNGLVD
ncbi:MAG: hypothetical protein M1820_005409 [Bogoriella megaspora]|nr:MAG: hypothetical protein M1820_005409 [Bogoriella megaspora]